MNAKMIDVKRYLECTFALPPGQSKRFLFAANAIQRHRRSHPTAAVEISQSRATHANRHDPCQWTCMDATEKTRRETEALIEAIWGPEAVAAPALADPIARAAQNRALAEAMKAYLQQYLADA